MLLIHSTQGMPGCPWLQLCLVQRTGRLREDPDSEPPAERGTYVT